MFWTCCKLVPSPTKFSSQQTALQELAEFWSHEKDTLWYRSHPVFKDSVIFSWRLCDSETLSSYLIGPVPTLSRRMTHLMCYLFVSSEMAPRVRAAWIHNGSGNNLQDECAKNTIKLSHAVYQYTHDLKRWILNTCIGIEMPSNHEPMICLGDAIDTLPSWTAHQPGKQKFELISLVLVMQWHNGHENHAARLTWPWRQVALLKCLCYVSS